MKMTRLEWTYLQRIALDHPYFDTHKLPLTEKEAKAIVEANNTMTGKEFVDSIYANLGMIRPKEEKKRFAWLRGIGELFAVPPIRKIAIALLVVILMAVFFAATPTGRAIAESVVRYFVQLIDNKAVISKDGEQDALCFVNSDEPSRMEDITAETFANENSFDEFRDITGRTPFVLSLECEKIKYYQNKWLMIVSEYRTPYGVVTLTQSWNNDEDEMIAVSSERFHRYTNDLSMYYSIDDNGTISCICMLRDSILILQTDEVMEIDYLMELITDSKYQ